MICKFCSQWNAATTKRCVFCHNELDASEDATASGVVRQTNVSLPKVNMTEQSALGGKSFELVDILIWGVILLVAATVGIVCPVLS